MSRRALREKEWRRWCRYFAGALLAACCASSARASDVPVENQATILVRALAYDGDLLVRAGADFSVGVLYDASIPGAAASAVKTYAAFQRLAGVTVQGLAVSVILLPYEGPAQLREQIRGRGIDTIYLQQELDAQLDDILSTTKQEDVISMASQKSQIERGASIGAFLVNDSIQLRINLAASKAEGARFKAALLKIAHVVK